MKILITGASGFIGRHLVPNLLEQGHAITAVARNEEKARRLSWFPRVCFLSLDVHRHPERLERYLENIDAVAHLAWPGLPNYQDALHFERTLPADYRFLKGLVERGTRHVLVTGTCFEYGMQSGALDESRPTAPATAYGLAKDTLRKFLEHLRQQSPFNFQWARLFYLFGEGQHHGSLLAQLDQAIDRGDQSFDMSSGDQLRDYLPVTEAAAYLATLLEHPECSGVINVCSGTPISIRRLVENHVTARRSHIALHFGRHPYLDYEPMAFWGKCGQLLTLRARRSSPGERNWTC